MNITVNQRFFFIIFTNLLSVFASVDKQLPEHGYPQSVGERPHINVFAVSVPVAQNKGVEEVHYEATVLLCEDDPDDVLLTQIAFEKARLANPLQIVRDGEEAIAYLKGEGRFADRTRFPLPILVLLDLKMPKLDGFHVLQWLRSHSELDRTPVAIMTSSDHDPDISRAYELGADSYLIKPPDAEALLALVQRLRAYWLILNEPQGTMLA
jgi:Response regulators consisting of a CheY-like receiver domain and a winged-helix DNA-binding domain